MTTPLDLAPPVLPALDPAIGWAEVPGARLGVVQAGIKKPKAPPFRDDVVVLVAPGTAAAVVTRSTALAAPCRWTRDRVPGAIHAVVVNSGNANASTGPQGEADCAATAQAVADALGCAPDAVLVCSTGVIGVPMPMERMAQGARDAALRAGQDSSARGAGAILTTDLVPKQAGLRIGGLTVAGMAKGSGMIHPNMGTMLGFVATDAQVAGADLQRLVAEVADRSFNAVTVDGDTSTNDTLIVQATGLGPVAAPGNAAWDALAAGLEAVCRELARAIARDGEGATTLVEVVVAGAGSDAACRDAARAVIRSPLVKTAIAGRDPNWGRVIGALGAAGVPGLDHCDLDFAGVPVLRAGRPLAFDEATASAALDQPDVRISIRLPGAGLGFAWGCDLTADYVKINADYRT